MIGSMSVRPVGKILDIWDKVLGPLIQTTRRMRIGKRTIPETRMRTMTGQSVLRRKRG